MARVAGGAFWYVICQSASDLMGAGGDLRNMSQMLCRCRYDRCTGIKNGPEIRGHWSKVLVHGPAQRKKTTASETVHLQASEAEIGKVPIAQRGTGRGHQRTVDGGHQAAEQGGGGREADGSSLGHCRPLSKARRIAASGLGIMYVYQIPATTRLFAWQHFVFCNATWPWY